MTMIDVTATERKIAERIDPGVTNHFEVSTAVGGLGFSNMSQAMEFAKMMSISSVAIPKHLRGNPGACLAVVIQAIEWKLSPYAVANKSYSVNDRLAYESQLVQAVILQRAPIKGRFKVEYTGEGDKRVCKVWAKLRDGDETVDYESPPFGKIQPKNSPLWKSDPDQQQFYYSGRALCRRHFPDVLLGVYAEDEMTPDPERARDVTPTQTLSDKLDVLAQSVATQDNTTTDSGSAPTQAAPAGEDAAPGGSSSDNSPQTNPPVADQAAPDANGSSPAPEHSGAAEGWPDDKKPTNEAEYARYCRDGWFRKIGTEINDPLDHWKRDKAVRSKAFVGEEIRDELFDELNRIVAGKKAA